MQRWTLTAALIATALALQGCKHKVKELAAAADVAAQPLVTRVATFNLEDVRTDDVRRSDHPRLKAAATVIQELHPDVIFLNEVAYDQPGAPGYVEGEPAGQNGQRFADNFLAVAQGEELKPIVYRAFMAPSNTGIPSGHDLDNDGEVVTKAADGEEGRAYGADCWGFGTFPGQYGMTLLVREGIEIVSDEIRTFQKFPWSTMPDALQPMNPDTNQRWYTDDEWASFPLSSKSHWDVPLRLANGQVIHLLCSHPTPPVFDGPDDRNGCRNHDEIRFWVDYLNDEKYLVDDKGRVGGLPDDAYFVIVGDLNSDPDEGEGSEHPIAKFHLSHPRIQGDFMPKATSEGTKNYQTLDDDDTAEWGMRADYVLPSKGLKIVDGGIVRPTADAAAKVSDHFPVWLDLEVPGDSSRFGSYRRVQTK